MSGTTPSDPKGRPRPIPVRSHESEFETDLQCALTSTSPVLITGPDDVTAAVAARIHHNSLNRQSAFVTLECSRTDREEQIEHVFDHAAPRGTVFLRDVDRLTPALQSQLFGRIQPRGVRVIAATSVSLLYASEAGAFDERLFYRLNQIHLMTDRPLVPSDAA